jgi:sortase A
MRRGQAFGETGPRRRRRSILAGVEWFLLVFGLIALDCCIWIYTSSELDQAYEDWAFDQTLLGSKPSVSGFIGEEIRVLFGRTRVAAPTPEERAERLHPAPSTKPLENGLLIGRLRISRLKMAAMVREGANESTLRLAVGHVPGTALPGNIGNVGLAGHRDTFFRPLAKIHKNDAIDLETDQGIFRYLVTSTQIVSPRDVSVLKASAGKTLTLVTCYPFYYVGSAPKRFIVHAVEAAASQQPPPQPGS